MQPSQRSAASKRRIRSQVLSGIIAVTVLVTMMGCATARNRKAKQQKPAPASPIYVGVITLVNDVDRFVLIDGGGTIAPADGTALKVFRDGTETGILKVGSVKRRQFLIADIVQGDPQKGDRVFQ